MWGIIVIIVLIIIVTIGFMTSKQPRYKQLMHLLQSTPWMVDKRGRGDVSYYLQFADFNESADGIYERTVSVLKYNMNKQLLSDPREAWSAVTGNSIRIEGRFSLELLDNNSIILTNVKTSTGNVAQQFTLVPIERHIWLK
jgi:hypothetical protein